MAIPFVTEIDVEYGRVDRLSPRIRRVIAENPSKFTFHGTGTYLVGEGDTVAVIDPGPDDDAHLAALMAAVDGETVSHIVITHTHRDHSPLAARLQELTGAPTHGFGPHGAHEWPDDPVEERQERADAAAEREAAIAAGEIDPDNEPEPETNTEKGHDEGFVPDVAMRHGDTVSGAGWTLEAVHTPGHTSNHLCFGLTDEDVLFSGDHVMGWSTSVIGPPDGDMAAYFDSLRLLLDRGDITYWPTHGPAITEPRRHVMAFLDHRLAREAAIADLLRTVGPSKVADLVPTMYADVDLRLHRPAKRSVHSHLLRMEAAGEIRCEGDPRVRSEAVWSVA